MIKLTALTRSLKLLLFKNSIVRNIFITFFVTNLVIIVALGIILIRDSMSVLTKDAEKYNYQIVEQVILGLNNMLNEIKEPLYVLSRNSSVLEVMKNYNDMSNADKLKYEREIEELSYSLSRYKTIIRDILILGENGYRKNLKSGKPIDWEYDFTIQPWYIESISSKTVKIKNLGLHQDDYYLNSNHNQDTLSIAIPAVDYYGNVVGAIVGNLELNHIGGLLNLNPYNRGELKLISNEGQILADANEEIIGMNFPLDLNEDMLNNEPFSIQAELNGERSIITSMPVAIDEWNLVHTITLDEVTKSTDVLKRSNVIVLLIFLLINFSLVIILSVWIYNPIKSLLSDLTKNKTFDLKRRDYKFIELNKINAKYMDLLERVNGLTRKNYQSTIALKESEIKALYSQINPHVLFNTLQLLQTEIVHGNKKESNQIILSLSNLLRYSMNQSDKMIEISKEIKYIKDYLFIINKKFLDKVKLIVDVPDNILKTKITKLTIQPIVENCIKHGLQEGGGEITIEGLHTDKAIIITVSDNGIGISEQKMEWLKQLLSGRTLARQPNHIGLYNVDRRLKYQYGNDYGIRIDSKEKEYTRVKIIIPKLDDGM